MNTCRQKLIMFVKNLRLQCIVHAALEIVTNAHAEKETDIAIYGAMEALHSIQFKTQDVAISLYQLSVSVHCMVISNLVLKNSKLTCAVKD